MTTRRRRQQRSLQLVLLSDTHEQEAEVDVPPGDILIHAGDFTMFSRSIRSIIDFNRWLGELPHRWKLLCGGNHETFLQAETANRRKGLRPRRGWPPPATRLVPAAATSD